MRVPAQRYTMAKRILGISAFYHDSAAALVRDGEIVAAAQEERFTRKKHDAAFPRHAVAYCLRRPACGIDRSRLVGFYDKPCVKFERMLETYLGYAPRGLALVPRPRCRCGSRRSCGCSSALKRELAALDGGKLTIAPLLFAEHHESHAASAFFPSRSSAPRSSPSTASASGRRPRSGWARATGSTAQWADRFPALARPALLGLHLLHRLQGQLRRVQGDGPRAVRRAELRRR